MLVGKNIGKLMASFLPQIDGIFYIRISFVDYSRKVLSSK